jgi:hypothetical protein
MGNPFASMPAADTSKPVLIESNKGLLVKVGGVLLWAKDVFKKGGSLAVKAVTFQWLKPVLLGVKALAGQICTVQFWVDWLGRFLNAAGIEMIKTLGGSLTWYGEKKSTPEVSEIRTAAQRSTTSVPVVTPAQQAFASRSYHPNTTYGSSPYAPPPSSSDFPGFQSR